MLIARHLSRRLPAVVSRRSCAAMPSSAASHILVTPAQSDRSCHLTTSQSSYSHHRTFSSSSSSLKESYDYILTECRFPEPSSDKVVGGGVGIITLHRPKALNALSDALFEDLIHALKAMDNDDEIGCIVITGSGKAFAAGKTYNFICRLMCYVIRCYLWSSLSE